MSEETKKREGVRVGHHVASRVTGAWDAFRAARAVATIQCRRKGNLYYWGARSDAGSRASRCTDKCKEQGARRIVKADHKIAVAGEERIARVQVGGDRIIGEITTRCF